MNKIFIFVIAICLFFLRIKCYIQFQLVKRTVKRDSEHFICDTKSIEKDQNQELQNQQMQYKQFCYQKDTSYYIQLFHEKEIYEMSMDITSPISWLKGSQCQIIDNNQKKCQILNPTIKQVIKNKIIQRKSINKKFLTPQKKLKSQSQREELQNNQQNSQKHQNQNLDLVKIYGSNQIISGYLQKNHDIQFWSKDSGRLSRLADILMLGFYFIQEKQMINLKNANFIIARQVSEKSNSLSDGSISLRFDQNSQNSFLTQIFEFAETEEKIITIYLSQKQNIITIGQLSIKYSAEGYSGIKWINLTKTSQYGILPKITSFIVQNLKQNQEHKVLNKLQIFGVITLSASYIGIPQNICTKIIQYFDALAKCKINQQLYLQCSFSNKKHFAQFKQLNLVFQFDAISISLPINQLIITQKQKRLVLNIKQIIHKQYLVLGEPVFAKYFTILDYQKNRIGFSLKKQKNSGEIINVVSLIRFVSFVFVLGCSILLCFYPLQKMINSFKRKHSYNNSKTQGRRLKYSTEQNSYDQVNQKLKEVFQQ